MQMKFVIVACLLAVGLSAAMARVADVRQPTVMTSSARQRFTLPKVFDFENFKQLLGRKYVSLKEELTRQKIYLANALRAYVSAVAYKFNRSKYYMGVTEMSDWTQEEIERTKMNVIMSEDLEAIPIDSMDVDLETPMLDLEDVKEELANIKKFAEGSSELRPLADELGKLEGRETHSRMKRRVYHRARGTFDLEDIAVRPVPISSGLRKRIITSHLDSNNPDYKPIEMESQGIGDLFQPLVGFIQAEDKRAYVGEVLTNFIDYMTTPVDESLIDETATGGLPDGMFVDHRQGKCLMPIQSQGRCGSCYAFAVNAYFEWAICKETGQLVKLSEQYAIDCGKSADMGGCGGAIFTNMGEFYKKFGAELTRHYPYVAKEGQCPFERLNATDKVPGYLKLHNPHQFRYIPRRLFEAMLPYGPLVVNIGAEGTFPYYKGGVHDGAGCCGPNDDQCGRHSVLLVGHGREDGEEFWLFRNSHGTHYGDQGYYKLNKKAEKCIMPYGGFKFGTKDGINVKLLPTQNTARPQMLDQIIQDKSRYRTVVDNNRISQEEINRVNIIDALG